MDYISCLPLPDLRASDSLSCLNFKIEESIHRKLFFKHIPFFQDISNHSVKHTPLVMPSQPQIKISYNKEADILEVILKKKKGYFKETANYGSVSSV